MARWFDWPDRQSTVERNRVREDTVLSEPSWSDMLRSPDILALLLSLVSFTPPPVRVDQKPAAKDPKATIEALFDADRFGSDLSAIDADVVELEATELHTSAEIKDWSARLSKLWSKGA